MMDYKEGNHDMDKTILADKIIVEFDCEENELKNGRLIGNKKEDVAYRHRIFHTACVCFSMFALGWRNALIGPTLPDLRLLINVDLSTASWIFTVKSLGGILGSLVGGYSYDRFNKIGVFVIIVGGMGIMAAVTPWCTHLATMLLVHALHGVFNGAIDTAATADMATVWKQNGGPFIQAVHFGFSIGAIISPLSAESFLAETISTDAIYSSGHSYSSNVTSSSLNRTIVRFDIENVSEYATMNASSVEYGTSKIYVPYSIAAVVIMISAVMYLVVLFFYGSVYKSSYTISSESKNDSNISKKRYFLTKTMKIVFTILIALSLLFYVVSEHCFIGFLMTFLISELKWSKAKGSTASSAFWIAFAIGRLSGIIMVKFARTAIMIILFFSVLTSGGVFFLLAVIFDIKTLVWIAIVIIGYGMSAVFGLVFTWQSENIRTMTGKITSIFFIFMSTGNMVVPILVGYLMDKISQMYFVYTLIVFSVGMFVMFIFVLVSFNLFKKADEKSEKLAADLTVNQNCT